MSGVRVVPKHPNQLTLEWDVAPKLDPRSVVYFIEAKATGLVKIGTTRDLAKRLQMLRCHSHCPLHVVKVIAGERKVEAELHRRFAAHRSHGEWFWMEPIRAAIDALEHVEGRVATCSDCQSPIRHWQAKRCRLCEQKRRRGGRPPPRCRDCHKRLKGRVQQCFQCYRRSGRSIRPSLPFGTAGGAR